MLTRNNLKAVLQVMFAGWKIREESWNGSEYLKTSEQAMIEAAGGDENVGYLVYLFDHWANDIQGMAPRFGLTLDRDETDKLVIRECEVDTSPLFLTPLPDDFG